jgi:signal peptidase I
VAEVFGGRDDIVPKATADGAGDLAPAGVGSRGATLTVQNLRLLRDIYYIADKHDRERHGDITDLSARVYAEMTGRGDPTAIDRDAYDQYLTDPSLWSELVDRREYDFPLQEDQFFVLGDNSPSSKDSRLWMRGEQRQFGSKVFEVKQPGGPYVERRLLTGKALFVYWPHSWGKVPGTNIPLPFFPNVWDMRLVR